MKRALLYLSLIALASCEINQSDVLPTDEFVKVYNDPDENLVYYASGVIQLDDGFLILSAVVDQELYDVYPTTNIIKTNDLGEVVWTLSSEWLAPSKPLNINGTYGFVAMDVDNQGFFVSINTESGEISGSTDLDITSPLSAEVIYDNQLVVLGYNYGSWASIVSLYNSDLQNLNTQNLSIGEDYVSSVDAHLNKTGYEYPFFIGEWEQDGNSGFFVNCLRNYTLGVNFFDTGGTRTSGWIIVHQVNQAPSSLLHKDENQYALTLYNNGANYFSPSIEVDIDAIQNYNDFTENPLSSLSSKARITSKMVSFNSTDFMTFTSTTNYNAIQVSQYQLDNDELYHTKEVDFSDITEVVDVIQDTNDEGIIILARTFVTGRYQRPMLVKIPKEQFLIE